MSTIHPEQKAVFVGTAAALLALILLALAGCGPTSVSGLEEKEQVRQLQAADILQLVENNTLFVHSFNEDSYLYFDRSGRLFGKDIYNNVDQGRWDVSEDGELCMRMNKWWYGDLRCYRILSGQKKLHLANANGVLQYSAQQLSGDAKHLYREPKGKRKSYRRFVRSQKQQTQTPSEASSSVPSPQKSTAPDSQPALVDTSRPAGSAGGSKDLRSTVKWMARDCPGCNLAGTDLKQADLVGANLMRANLEGASLRMANLRRANLQGANLSGADLSYANLPGANLRNADLRGANLQGANLIRADLTGARTNGAKFEGAHLDSAQGLHR